MMLQQDIPQDYVIATGVQFSVRDFIKKAASHLGITLLFEGKGVDEVARVQSISGDRAPALRVNDVVVKIDPRYFRPTEVETLLGDAGKACAELGWVPEITLDDMVREMVDYDFDLARRNVLLERHGFVVKPTLEN